MTETKLYAEHLARLDSWLADSLELAAKSGPALRGVLFHAGRSATYHADDQEIAFFSCPHFRRWTPLAGPEHVLLAVPGKTPIAVRVRPTDYWYDTTPPPHSYWEEALRLEEVASFAQISSVLGSLEGIAYVGNSPQAAAEVGIDESLVEPPALMAPLDWYRAVKTDHEIRLMRVAAEKGAAGHMAGREAFLAGGSEREIHWAYLRGSDQIERELPFEAIVALDQKASILHYQHKRGREAAPGKVLLLDAGAGFEGYASDITRTWVHDDVPAEFRSLLEAMDGLERDLVAMVTPGRCYTEIHMECHRRIAALLAETGVFKVGGEEAFTRGLTLPFMPHGVGHHLGIQVHDIGGRQAGPAGGVIAPPERHPFLRNTRRLEEGQVVTIEPGLYFIEILLTPLRAGQDASAINWDLVEELMPCGGIRIEDDILCRPTPEDLTRALVPGPASE